MSLSPAPLRTATLLAALAAILSGGAAAAQAAPAVPSLDERMHCQEALERVYWRHRSPNQETSFAQAVPQSVIRQRGEDAVLETAALQRFWGVTISPPQLQAELDRMAAGSQSPARLRELLAALDNDPGKAAECLARPLLVDRLVRSHYAHDSRLHADARARAEREAGELASSGGRGPTTGIRSAVRWRRGHDPQRSSGAVELAPEDFDARVRDLRRVMGVTQGAIEPGRASRLREDETRFSVVVVDQLDDLEVRLTTIEWPKRPFDSWWSEARRGLTPAPDSNAFDFRLPPVAAACADDTWTPTLQLLDPRYWHTAVWTGSEMIVYGGMEAVGTTYGDGSRYDPATDTWKLLPTIGSPGQRQAHVAVWTGTEMVVWGGRGDTTGGRYNPSTNSWTPTSTVNAPGMRWNASVVWTGTEMIVWGGNGGGFLLNDGGRYRPATDTWTPIPAAPLAPREYHAAVWTGSQLVVWGGYNGAIGQMYGDGARYTLATDSWTPVAASNAPNARFYHTAVWTGTEMIVWGGLNYPVYDLSGGRYDPVTDTWAPTSLVNAPSLRWFHVAVWTGTEMIVQGGTPGVVAGGRYDPVSDTWTATSPVNAANNGQGITAVWTGTEMIVWGGLDDDFVFHYDGGRYDPATDIWHPTGTMNVPTARGLHEAVWTGNEMMVWGGYSYGYPNTGGLYDPATDSWRATSTAGAPAGRENATAVWTGTEAIFWGGDPDGVSDAPGTGGRYAPASDSWILTSTVNAPTNRYGHTAVWAGSEMIVFGGTGAYDSIAKRYQPATNTWTNATVVDAPGQRDHHAAVWTGTEMIIWGGFIYDGLTPTGGRYDPALDLWTPTNVADSPETREWPVGVWTGTEMIVWGGLHWLYGDVNDGARYNPATDSWSPTNLVGAPAPRVAQGVWTGSELLLWGDVEDSSGGRYDPLADSWRSTTLVGAPQVLWGGRWSRVWTGDQMIVWGGMGPTQKGGLYCAAPGIGIFADGFESGDTSAWSPLAP